MVATIIAIFSLNDFRHAFDVAAGAIHNCGGWSHIGTCLYSADDPMFEGTVMTILRPAFVVLFALLVAAQILIWFFNRLAGGPIVDVVLSNEKLDEILFETKVRSAEIEAKLEDIETKFAAQVQQNDHRAANARVDEANPGTATAMRDSNVVRISSPKAT